MRAWLLLRLAEVPFEEIVVPLYREGSRAMVRAMGAGPLPLQWIKL